MPINFNDFKFTDEAMNKFKDWAKDFTNDFGESISEQLAKEENKRKEIQFQEDIEMKQGLEAIAKLSGFFYDGLLKQGFTENEALKLTAMYLSNLAK